MVMSLLFPKVILAAATFLYVPYLFSAALLAELVLLMLYQKAFFGQFGFLQAFSYATLISPALFQIPSESRSVKKLGPIGHSVILYLCFSLFIYVPTGLFYHLYYFKEVNVTSSILQPEQGLPNYVRIMITVYCCAPIMYIFLAIVYYKVNIFFIDEIGILR